MASDREALRAELRRAVEETLRRPWWLKRRMPAIAQDLPVRQVDVRADVGSAVAQHFPEPCWCGYDPEDLPGSDLIEHVRHLVREETKAGIAGAIEADRIANARAEDERLINDGIDVAARIAREWEPEVGTDG